MAFKQPLGGADKAATEEEEGMTVLEVQFAQAFCSVEFHADAANLLVDIEQAADPYRGSRSGGCAIRYCRNGLLLEKTSRTTASQ